MNLYRQLKTEGAKFLTRRWFLGNCGIGLGGMALNSLLSRDAKAVRFQDPYEPNQSHFPARVKRVIYLFQAGAPSQLELFDPKPELAKRDGQLPPAELLKGYRSAFINPNSALLGPKYSFAWTVRNRNGENPSVHCRGG